jgi:hypothetical protein
MAITRAVSCWSCPPSWIFLPPKSRPKPNGSASASGKKPSHQSDTLVKKSSGSTMARLSMVAAASRPQPAKRTTWPPTFMPLPATLTAGAASGERLAPQVVQ